MRLFFDDPPFGVFPFGAALGARCYTFLVPTARPRHVITETDEVARALDAAAERWPQDSDSRAKLVLHLLREGYRALDATTNQVTAERKETIRRTGGLLTGVYDRDYLEELRQGWPE